MDMISYTEKQDGAVTFAVFTSGNTYYEIPVTDLAEDARQTLLAEEVTHMEWLLSLEE